MAAVVCCRQRARGDGIAGGSVLATLRCSPPASLLYMRQLKAPALEVVIVQIYFVSLSSIRAVASRPVFKIQDVLRRIGVGLPTQHQQKSSRLGNCCSFGIVLISHVGICDSCHQV
jgi:hypothetical protein